MSAVITKNAIRRFEGSEKPLVFQTLIAAKIVSAVSGTAMVSRIAHMGNGDVPPVITNILQIGRTPGTIRIDYPNRNSRCAGGRARLRRQPYRAERLSAPWRTVCRLFLWRLDQAKEFGGFVAVPGEVFASDDGAVGVHDVQRRLERPFPRFE